MALTLLFPDRQIRSIHGWLNPSSPFALAVIVLCAGHVTDMQNNLIEELCANKKKET